MSGPIALTWLDLASAASLLLINGLLSVWLRLGLGRRLLIASVRSVVQLSLLGVVLVPVFRWRSPWLVAGICLLMVGLAGREAVRRVRHHYRGMTATAVGSMVLAAGTTVILGTAVIIQSDPWWEPRYLVPFLGMILGNSLNGISLGLDRALDLLDSGRHRVEAMLARGATRWEASRPVAAESIRMGLIPILNTMSVVGIVSIPGMMTGQILGGTPPEQAARYQILILFLIAGAIAIGVGGAVLITLRVLIDADHRLRVDRLGLR